MAAGSPSGGVDEAPCRSLTPVSCCGQGTSAPAPAASAPPVAAPAAVALAALPYALPAQAAPVPRDERATPSPALRSVVLRL